jgi:hypothetical protein
MLHECDENCSAPKCAHCDLPFPMGSQTDYNVFANHLYEKHRRHFLAMFAEYGRCAEELRISMDFVLVRNRFYV